MHGRGQTTETVLQLIDGGDDLFSQHQGNSEITGSEIRIRKADVKRIIHVARSTAEKLTCLSRTCTGTTQGGPHGFMEETLPEFAEYVRRKYGVELEEDLIERQKQKVKA